MNSPECPVEEALREVGRDLRSLNRTFTGNFWNFWKINLATMRTQMRSLDPQRRQDTGALVSEVKR